MISEKDPLPSLERIYPSLSADGQLIGGSDTQELHFERYRFAGMHLSGGHIADVACGAGYGSFFLAKNFPDKVRSLTAVDIDKEAIEYAMLHYSHSLIQFFCHNAVTYQPSVEMNSVVSLETIEHLPDPQLFVKHWAAHLAPGGRFIASAPITPSMDANPYHLHDFTPYTFRKLFKHAGLKEIGSMIQIQRYKPTELFKSRDGRSHDLRKNLFHFYFKNPNKAWLRFQSVLRDGFCNKYLIVVFEKN